MQRGRRCGIGVASLILTMAIALSLCPAAPAAAGDGSGGSAAALEALAAGAYVWGLPLVVSLRTVQTFARLVGVNRLFDERSVTGPQTRLIVEPNVDTLYSVAVLDLRS